MPEQPVDVPEGPVFERGEVRGCSARASRKTPIYDAAIVLDPLTEGFAKGEGIKLAT